MTTKTTYTIDELSDKARGKAVREYDAIYSDLEYPTSEEAIIDTIRAKEFLFTIDGSRYKYLY